MLTLMDCSTYLDVVFLKQTRQQSDALVAYDESPVLETSAYQGDVLVGIWRVALAHLDEDDDRIVPDHVVLGLEQFSGQKR